MTTTTSAARIRHDSDATFQEWVSEMTVKLAACGLVQTGDTGQINPATALRPAVNTLGGYQIWRFDDPLQPTFPVFMRVEYRTGNGVTAPLMNLGVGTSTNGAGTLTGLNYTGFTMATMNTAQATDTLRNSYWCHTAHGFGMIWKAGSSNTETMVILARTVNPTTGAPTGDGLLSLRLGNNHFGCHVFKFSAPTSLVTTATVNDAQLCHWPMIQATSSLVGVDPQVGLAFIPVNRVTPVVGVVGVRDAEFTSFNTFSFTPVGATAHTYLSGPATVPYMSASNFLKPAMLWE